MENIGEGKLGVAAFHVKQHTLKPAGLTNSKNFYLYSLYLRSFRYLKNNLPKSGTAVIINTIINSYLKPCKYYAK